jgi:hypothetical protein
LEKKPGACSLEMLINLGICNCTHACRVRVRVRVRMWVRMWVRGFVRRNGKWQR